MERRCSRFEGLKALSRERGNGRVIAGGELFEKRVRLVELLGGEVVIGEVEEVVFVVLVEAGGGDGRGDGAIGIVELVEREGQLIKRSAICGLSRVAVLRWFQASIKRSWRFWSVESR